MNLRPSGYENEKWKLKKPITTRDFLKFSCSHDDQLTTAVEKNASKNLACHLVSGGSALYFNCIPIFKWGNTLMREKIMGKLYEGKGKERDGKCTVIA